MIKKFLGSDNEGMPGLSKREKLIYGSAGGGVAMILLGLIVYLLTGSQIAGGMLILGMIVSILPYGILSFIRNRHRKEMERQFPAFLKGLAESKRGGMTLLNALESSKETDYGRLNQEIERVYNELTWGIPFPEVMERFSQRVSDSAVMQQSLSIIIQSFKSGGNITHTIESVAEDASKLREAVAEKNSRLKQQLLIMYVIYFLFIGITIGIYIMLDQLLALGSAGSGALGNVGEIIGGGGSSEVQFCSDNIIAAQPFCGIARIFGFIPADIAYGSSQAIEMKYEKMAYYKSLLFTMLMIQGIATSGVAGKISEGKAIAGVKHAIIMLPVAFITFMLIIAPQGI